MTTYRLGSNHMVYTPGILRWALNGYAFKKDREYLRKIFTEGWGIPDDAAHALLSREIPHQIADDTVIFTFPKETVQ